MPRSLHFYRVVLGFEIVSRSPTYAVENGVELFHWVLLRREATELMLNTAYDVGERPETRDRARETAHADARLFFGCPDVDAAYVHVRAHGVPCPPPYHAWYGMRQLSFRDPDGYGITLQWRV
jgi:catechol 2,3-dioxygenase-like lactoylglutathione lyase family enzyme